MVLHRQGLFWVFLFSALLATSSGVVFDDDETNSTAGDAVSDGALEFPNVTVVAGDDGANRTVTTSSSAQEEEEDMDSYHNDAGDDDNNTDIEDDDDPWADIDGYSHQRALVYAYLSKPFSLLSMVCSYVLIREVVVDQRTKVGGPITRMLLSMGIADMIYSFGYFLTTWPAPPTDTGYSHPDTVGAMGSIGFCTFQGFCIQLGLVASLLSNAALSMYFLLVVYYSWTDLALKRRVEPWTQGCIWLCALVLAIYPIPMKLYNSDNETCNLNSLPSVCGEEHDKKCIRGSDPTIPHSILAVFPLSCICWTAFVMIKIYIQVRQIETRSGKYSKSFQPSGGCNGSSSSSGEPTTQQLNRVSRKKSVAVGKQAISFALAFLLTYSISILLGIAYYASGGWWNDILSDVAFSVLAPSAGAFNLFVFARPRTIMKTPEGRLMRAILFCTCCYEYCSGSTNNNTDSTGGGNTNSGSQQQKAMADSCSSQTQQYQQHLQQQDCTTPAFLGIEERKVEEG